MSKKSKSLRSAHLDGDRDKAAVDQPIQRFLILRKAYALSVVRILSRSETRTLSRHAPVPVNSAAPKEAQARSAPPHYEDIWIFKHNGLSA